MKKVEITIADNMTPQQEAVEIFKQLAQKAIAEKPKQKRLGQVVEVIDQKTLITVTRTSEEKVIPTKTCSVCGTEFTPDVAKHYFHNYGGNTRKVAVCSSKCREIMVEYLGDRASKSKAGLKSLKFF
jgi:predicted nucleic acid-binding Zn ribbon protein